MLLQSTLLYICKKNQFIEKLFFFKKTHFTNVFVYGKKYIYMLSTYMKYARYLK